MYYIFIFILRLTKVMYICRESTNLISSYIEMNASIFLETDCAKSGIHSRILRSCHTRWIYFATG